MKDIRRNNIKWILGICCLCLLLSLSSCGGQSGIYVEQSGEEIPTLPNDLQETEEEDISQDLEIPRIYVQVSGAVGKPGVYELSEGSRVFEAIALAGGVSPEADERLLNQAQPLTDGQMIYVYAKGEAPEETAGQKAQEQDGRVNLNTASMEQLMELPGIGQAKAEGILAYREAHGAFGKIEDVMEIEGIKEGIFSKIKDRIKVD